MSLLELKNYQRQALQTIEKYLQELKKWREMSLSLPEAARSAFDYPREAWRAVSRVE